MFVIQSSVFPAKYFSPLWSITRSHDQPWVCIVNCDLCILSLKVLGHSAVTNILVLSMNCFPMSISAEKSNLFYFISWLWIIVLEIDLSALVNTYLFWNSLTCTLFFQMLSFNLHLVERDNIKRILGMYNLLLFGKEKHG